MNKSHRLLRTAIVVVFAARSAFAGGAAAEGSPGRRRSTQ